MKAGPLHHIAVAVPSLDAAIPFYRDTLGLVPGEPQVLRDQGVRTVFLGAQGEGPLIELVEPLDHGSGVGRFVAERGRPTLHHVCFVVDDLRATLADLASRGIELIDREPRRGAGGEVAFLHPRAGDGVLVELIDRASLRSRSHT